MKKIIANIQYVVFLAVLCSAANAQNTFPSTGRAGVYTTSPAASLQVKGGARIGTSSNYVNIDSATGNLSFTGTATYRVANNQYAFQNAANPGIGLYFNATNARYEFRNSASAPTFYVGATTGNGVFIGNLKVGAYTLPATDGANGQILKTNGSGVLTWSADNGGSGSGWSLTGNAGTNASTNFIGTTDAQALAFRVNNQKSGNIDFTGNNNTSFGYQTLLTNTTGANNVALGFGALKANIAGGANTAIGASALINNGIGANASLDEGTRNTAVGAFSMLSNTTGLYNTAVGVSSLAANTSGYFNTALGLDALQSNIDGHDNTATGLAALNINEGGSFNTATGSRALQANTFGNNNVANGYSALYNNTTGEQNTATGYASLYANNGSYNSAHGSAALNNNTNGIWNTANGAYAMYLNTSGYYNTATGGNALYSNIDGVNNTANGYNALYNNVADNNTAVGHNALYTNTTGSGNTAIGLEALYFNTDGYFNTAVGTDALLSNTMGGANTAVGNVALLNNTTGVFNTACGFHALMSNETGTGNTAIGADANTNNGLENATAIGYSANTDASNKVRIGNNAVTSIGGQVGWSNFSDGRYKKNIKQDVQGLAFINSLQPITYTVDINGLNEYYAKGRKTDSNYENSKVLMKESNDKAAAIVYNGFIAQDVEKAAAKLNYNFSGVDKPQTKDGLYGLRYADFVVPLVKAVQELSKMNDDKDAAIQTQNVKIDDLQKQVDELKAMIIQSSVNNQQSTIISSASLEQNIPNPFANSTTINYTLPQKFEKAQIIITDKNGKTIKAVNISGNGRGSLNIDASTLASCAYQYSLLVDGKLIASKQMVLTR